MYLTGRCPRGGMTHLVHLMLEAVEVLGSEAAGRSGSEGAAVN